MYNKKTLEEALALQKKMNADMGGTEIYKPLEEIYKTKPTKNFNRQVLRLMESITKLH